jgi:hypothetical protein
MNNLFNPSDTSEILTRLSKLQPDAQRHWGKMQVNQMLAHCNASLETAMGLNQPKELKFCSPVHWKNAQGKIFRTETLYEE